MADGSDGLTFGDQLLGRSLRCRSPLLELADDVVGCMPGEFYGRVPGPVWPDEDSHSLWTGFQGPRHLPSLLEIYGDKPSPFADIDKI